MSSLQPLSARPAGAPEMPAAQDATKLRRCAKDFEGLLVAQMLRSAHESGMSSGLGGDDDNDANSTMLEMGEQQFAQVLADQGGLGLANMVVAGLKENAH